MAGILIAAPTEERAKAEGLAEALRLLGFEASAEMPPEAAVAAAVDSASCVLSLWSRAAPPAWLAVAATLALERKKLINAELDKDSTPAPFQAAPRIDFTKKDRAGFKARFESLVVELDKLTPTKAEPDSLPDALARARGALLTAAAGPARGIDWPLIAGGAVAVVVMVGVGFGVGRVIRDMRNGAVLMTTTQAEAAQERQAEVRRATERARATSAPVRTPEPTPRPSADPFPQFAAARLQAEPWRTTASRITEAEGRTIKSRAAEGDGLAQALACLGHLSGAPGFLPSPTQAREFCDASAAQNQPAGLYFSWVLRRNAPHAGIDEATARGRLAEAARAGWLNALIDYGLTLAPTFRAPVDAQAEAGRLWLTAAERGDPRGQYHYARWLRDSPAGPRDPTASLPFLQRAADRGQADAQHMLATLYRDGIGAPRDPARARALYELAARQSHAASMFNLADMLRSGAPADRARAAELFRALACMRDERQIQPMAVRRLRALGESAACA